jgi:hypothetical protein
MPIEKARTEFKSREDVKALIKESEEAGNYGFSDEVDRLWDTTFVKPYEAKERELLAVDPGAQLPDQNCNECQGTGIETSTYNPNSKWDWYQLGGRWAEIFKPFQGVTVSEFAKATDDEGKPFRTFAIVTPDAQWLEKGKMLFFAIVADRKEPQEWEGMYADVLTKYADHKALFYDCHI